MKLSDISSRLQTLVLFRNLLNDPVLSGLCTMLEAPTPEHYAAFTARLFQQTVQFSDYICGMLLADENPYVLNKGSNRPIPPEMEDCLAHELELFDTVAAITSEDVKASLHYDGFLPDWQNHFVSIPDLYRSFIQNIPVNGYGIFAQSRMFYLDCGKIMPVQVPDPIRIADLESYTTERAEVLSNTHALIKGKPAANALLYGDSGTGKSSTVKAVVNELYSNGLRLIEVRKDQLHFIPDLINILCGNPLKFILFIDDLSFRNDDDQFSILKAMLEGSSLAQSENIAIYATSNRRHLVRESFLDRAGDDIHINETIQQLVSLSDRFGLTVLFATPNKEEYLKIVAHVANIYEIHIPQDELFRQAEVYALHKGGRSPRVARQFIESILSSS